jgi:hypothetical protein
MLVLAMEFSRGSPAGKPPSGGAARGQREADAHRKTSTRSASPERPRTPFSGPCRSLKTEQRCPTVLAAPHRRPKVYDRGDARATE